MASNAVDALRLADKNYNCIFLDIGLPDINGIELASQLRLLLQHPTRLIALTVYTNDDTKEKCFSAGIKAIFHKPVSSDLLKKVIKNIK